MRHLRSFGAAGLAAALLSATAADALTADQVWTSIQKRMAAFGQTVEVGSRSQSGGTLALKSVTSTYSGPDSKATAVVTIPEIDLAEGSGGSVTLTIPEKASISIKAEDPKGGSFDMALGLAPTGLKSVVTGQEGDITYATTADELKLTLDRIVADGKPVDAKGGATVSGIDATAHISGTDPETIDSKAKIASLNAAFDINPPDNSGPGHLEFTVADLQSTGKVTLPKAFDPKDMPAALAAGYSVASDLSYGKSSFSFSATAKAGVTKAIGSLDSGTLTLGIDKTGMKYGGGSKNGHLNIAAADLPFPVELTEQETAFNFSVPVLKSDQPQDFGLLVKLIGVGLNNEVWSMIDPQSQLPHDPATLIVDLAGSGKLSFNLLDANLKDHPPMDPGELKSLKLNQLQLTAVGADLTGTGALTFDNAAGQVPKPVGSVDLKLVGGNTLLDKLIKMGLLPQDQAMGFKMMIGMFTKPEGEDTLTSKIEFKDDGSILANGQRVK